MGLVAGAAVDLRVIDGKLVADPIRNPREGWAEDAARIAALPPVSDEDGWASFGNDGAEYLTW